VYFRLTFEELNYVLKKLILGIGLFIGSSLLSFGQNCSFPAFDLPSNINYCLGDTVVLSTGLDPAGLTFAWNTGATSPTISLANGSAGMFWVQVSDGSCTEGDTVMVGLFPSVDLNLGNDIDACKGESVTITANTSPSLIYTWNDGSNAPNLNVSQSGVYTLTVSNGVCEDVDQLRVTFFDYPELNLGPDTFICEPTQLVFNLSHQSSSANYSWYNGSSNPVHVMYADETQTIFVTASISVCSVSDSLTINLVDPPQASLIKDTIMCTGDNVSITAKGNAQWSYRWSNGNSTNVLITNVADTYLLSVTDAHCTQVQSVRVREIKEPQVNIIAPFEICAGENEYLDATTDGVQYYQWSDGTTNPLKLIQDAGEYYVNAFYQCGVVKDTALVDNCECFVRFPTAFRPMPSGVNKTFGPVSDCEISKYKLSIFDRKSQLLFETEDINQYWDGTYRGTKVQAGIYSWSCEYNAIENGENITIERSGFVTLVQ
jgi:gliding motility-associated-like protein